MWVGWRRQRLGDRARADGLRGRVWSHCRFRNRDAESLRESGMEWMRRSTHIKLRCDRAPCKHKATMRPKPTQAESYHATEPYLRAGPRRGQEGLRLHHVLLAACDDRLRRRAPGFSAAARGGRGAPRQLPPAAKGARLSHSSGALGCRAQRLAARGIAPAAAPRVGAERGRGRGSGNVIGPTRRARQQSYHLRAEEPPQRVWVAGAGGSRHNAFGSRVLAGAGIVSIPLPPG